MTFEVKTFDELVTEMKINLVNNVDEITDLNVGSVIYTIINTFGNTMEGIYTDLNTVYEGSRITTSTGDDLEEIGLIVGITRDAGIKSTGYVTFNISSPLSSDLTIVEDSQVSTQPNTSETQLVYNVTADTIFYATVSAETQEFLSGTYDYIMDQRFIDSLTTITGTVSSAAHTFTVTTDYSLVEDYDGVIVDNSTLVELNDCEAATNWVETAEGAASPVALTQDGTTYYQGDYSLRLGKTDTATTDFYYTYTKPTTIDATGTSLFIDLYINGATMLGKITSFILEYASDSAFTNSVSKTFSQSDVEVGWNKIQVTQGATSVTALGNIDVGAIKYFKISIKTSLITDTIAAGDLNIDNVIFAEYTDYVGDIVRFVPTATIPDDNTNIAVTYKPLSLEVPVEAANVGIEYNVGEGKIIYKISSFPSMKTVYNYESLTDGTDLETDDNLRNRIQNASELTNVSTVGAIENNVLALSFVETCSVIDMPETETLGEPQSFLDAAPTFRLDNLSPQSGSVIVFSKLTTEITTPVATTLNGGINDTVMSIVLTDTSSMADFGIILIDAEYIYYSAKDDGTNTLTVGTTLDGTTGRGHFGVSPTNDAAAHLTGAAVTLMSYENTVDFTMTDYFEVQFDTSANNPVDATTVYCDYYYDRIGFFDVYVTGTDGALTTTQLTTVDDLVDDIRSAGIFHTINEPTYTPITVEFDISVDTDYTVLGLTTSVKTAVINYVLSLETGNDVLLSKIIQAVMSVTGVTNVDTVTIDNFAVDKTILEKYKASLEAGSITVGDI